MQEPDVRSHKLHEFRSYRIDSRIFALPTVVSCRRWLAIKAVDLYFAESDGFAFCNS